MTTTVEPIKVLIADDHTLFRSGLAQMLNSDSRMRVVGEAGDGVDAVEKAMASRPDVVLMDLQMPGVDGLEATRLLTRGAPEVDVVLLSASTDQGTIGEGFESGAKGFLHKGASLRELIAVILDVRTARGAPRNAEDAVLSRRELNVLKHVASGLSNKQIAFRLGISEKTVRNHMSKVFTKLGAKNRTEAAMHAIRAGLLLI